MNFQPIFFEPNRVFRVYKGGKLLGDFLGKPSSDGNYPEEWIASAVRAMNKDSKGEKEGVSKPTEGDLYFDDLLKQAPEVLLGPKGEMRVLVKYLDSAVRLPAQAHPDPAFSKLYFSSSHGKTESWIILATRENAEIFFGFREGVGIDELKKAVRDSETDKTAMEKLMKRITPHVGDVFLVPAKTVHAIGQGCLILEVQEPTDFTIQPERLCGDYRLSDGEMYLGLDPETALGCFSFGEQPSAEVLPRVLCASEDFKKEALIDETKTPCFVINRVTLNGGAYRPAIPDSYGVYIVTRGEGRIEGDEYSHPLKQGDYFFLPFCAMGKYEIKGTLEAIECY